MKILETENFIVRLHDNLLKEFIVKKNKTLTANDIKESLRLTSEAKPGMKFYVLIEGEDNASVSGEARFSAASKEYANHAHALALYSHDPYLSVSGNLFLKVNKPLVPTKFFNNREEALSWLNGHMRKGT